MMTLCVVTVFSKGSRAYSDDAQPLTSIPHHRNAEADIRLGAGGVNTPMSTSPQHSRPTFVPLGGRNENYQRPPSTSVTPPETRCHTAPDPICLSVGAEPNLTRNSHRLSAGDSASPSVSMRKGANDSACSCRVCSAFLPTFNFRCAPVHQVRGICARRGNLEFSTNATVFTHRDERRRGPPRTVMRPHRDDPRMGSIAASLGASERFKAAALESTNHKEKEQGQKHVAA